MKITAAEVNKLRKQTGAGMMDCKKALQEAEGDFDAAVDILRKKGQKVAAKRSDRDAAEGLVLAQTTPDGKKGVMVVVNCETDFVAKNEDFGKFANKILEAAISSAPADLEGLKQLPFDGNGMTIGEKIIEQTGVIGEKIDLSGYEQVSAETVYAYNHPGNKLAAMVGLNKTGDLEEVAKDVAMQVAAMNPVALDKDQVPQEAIDREIEVGKDLAIQEGKPEELAEKIAMGRLNKFFQESTLLNQQYVKDSKKSIAQYLKEFDSGLTVTDFKRMALGE